MLTLSSAWKHSLNHSTTYAGKKYFIFLANLGRANIVTLSPCSQSSVDLAQGLSQRFVILLESYRYSPFLYRSTGCKFIRFLRSARDFLWVISEACSVVAQPECTSYQGEALTMGHILKTLYFAIIIIFHPSSIWLFTLGQSLGHKSARQPWRLQCTGWIKLCTDIINHVFNVSDILQNCWMAIALYEIQLLRAYLLFCWFHILVWCPRAACGHTVVVNRSGASIPSARYGAKNLPVIYWDVIPRRIRHTVLQRIISGPLQRTQKFLNSFDELEREVRGGNSGSNNSESPYRRKKQCSTHSRMRGRPSSRKRVDERFYRGSQYGELFLLELAWKKSPQTTHMGLVFALKPRLGLRRFRLAPFLYYYYYSDCPRCSTRATTPCPGWLVNRTN